MSFNYLARLLSVQPELLLDHFASDPRSLLRLARTCRTFLSICLRARVWKAACEAHHIYLPNSYTTAPRFVTQDALLSAERAQKLFKNDRLFASNRWESSPPSNFELRLYIPLTCTARLVTDEYFVIIDRGTVCKIYPLVKLQAPTPQTLCTTAHVAQDHLHVLSAHQMLVVLARELRLVDLRASHTMAYINDRTSQLLYSIPSGRFVRLNDVDRAPLFAAIVQSATPPSVLCTIFSIDAKSSRAAVVTPTFSLPADPRYISAVVPSSEHSQRQYYVALFDCSCSLLDWTGKQLHSCQVEARGNTAPVALQSPNGRAVCAVIRERCRQGPTTLVVYFNIEQNTSSVYRDLAGWWDTAIVPALHAGSSPLVYLGTLRDQNASFLFDPWSMGDSPLLLPMREVWRKIATPTSNFVTFRGKFSFLARDELAYSRSLACFDWTNGKLQLIPYADEIMVAPNGEVICLTRKYGSQRESQFHEVYVLKS